VASGDFENLSQAACRAAQLDPADTTGDLVRAKAAVNEAYLSTVGGSEEWDFLQAEAEWTTDPGDDVYTYAAIVTATGLTGATIREILTLTNDTDGLEMTPMSWQALERFTAGSQDDEADGSPSLWSKWAARIRLFPTPDAEYTMGTFLALAPAEMSNNTDVPLIPLAWRHRILVPYAAARLLEEEGGTEMVAQVDRLWARYREDFIRFRTAHGSAKQPTFNLMDPSFGADLPEAPW
jgi:hypothetical protein